MTVREKLLTAEELAQRPEDGKRHELVNGILVEMTRPRPRHGMIQARIAHYVSAYVEDRQLGLTTIETGYIIARNPDTVYGPDVAFVSKERLANLDLDKYIPGAPDLVVEIVASHESADEVATKVEDYLGAGTQAVWVVYPKLKTVFVYQSDQTIHIIRLDDTLDGGKVLPGFTLPLRKVFEGIK